MHGGANPGGGHGPPGHAFGGGGGGGWGGGGPAYSGPHGGPSASGTHYYGGGGGSGGGGGGGDDCALPGECMLWFGYLKCFAALCLAVAGLGMVDAEDGLAFMPLTSTAAGLAGLAFISLDLAGSAFRKFWKKSVRTAHTKARGESASSTSATVAAADTTERVNRSADAACSTSRRAAHALFLAFMALIIFTLLPTRDIKGNLYVRHAWGDGGRHLRAAATVATVAPGAQVRPRNGTEARARAPLPRSLEHAGGAPAERGPQSPVRKASVVPPTETETETDRRVLTAVLDGSAFRARGNDSVRSGLAFVPEVRFGGLWHPVCGERGFEENLVGASILCQMFGLPVGKVVHGSPDAAPAPTPTGAFPIGRCEPGQALHQCSAYAAIMPTQDEHDGVLRDCKDHSGVAIKCFNASEAHRVCEADDRHSHVRVWHNGSGPRCLGCDMLDSGTGCVDHYAGAFCHTLRSSGRYRSCRTGEYRSGCGANGQPGVCKPCTNSVPANASYSGRGDRDDSSSCPIECSADFPWLEKIWADDGTLMECRDTREQRSGCRKAHCFFEDAGGFKAFLVAAWVSYFLGLGLLHCDVQHWYKRARSARKAALKLEQEKCEKKAAGVKDEPETPAPLADRLQQLKDAHDRNLLNEEQYQAAVQQAVASVTL